jgi:hypothetical protein
MPASQPAVGYGRAGRHHLSETGYGGLRPFHWRARTAGIAQRAPPARPHLACRRRVHAGPSASGEVIGSRPVHPGSAAGRGRRRAPARPAGHRARPAPRRSAALSTPGWTAWNTSRSGAPTESTIPATSSTASWTAGWPWAAPPVSSRPPASPDRPGRAWRPWRRCAGPRRRLRQRGPGHRQGPAGTRLRCRHRRGGRQPPGRSRGAARCPGGVRPRWSGLTPVTRTNGAPEPGAGSS